MMIKYGVKKELLDQAYNDGKMTKQAYLEACKNIEEDENAI